MRNYVTLCLAILLSFCFFTSAAAQETEQEQKTEQKTEQNTEAVEDDTPQETDYNRQKVNADAPRPSFWKRVCFGGGFGLRFGEVTNITLAPNAIYQFNPYVGAGVGLNGMYASQKDAYKATVLGGSLIGTFNPIRQIQFSSEFEVLNVDQNYDPFFEANGYQDRNYWYPALFMGIGYNPGFMTIGVRYDVLYDGEKSIYGNPFMPFIRLSF